MLVYAGKTISLPSLELRPFPPKPLADSSFEILCTDHYFVLLMYNIYHVSD